MKEEKTTPLRQRMIEDMRIRGLCAKTQQAHIRNVKHFAGFLGRSPDTATPDDLRAYQLDMTKAGVSATTFNVRIISLLISDNHLVRHRQPSWPPAPVGGRA